MIYATALVVPFTCLLITNLLLVAPVQEAAAQKQGGGAFSTPAKKKPEKPRAKKTQPRVVSISGVWNFTSKCPRAFLNSRGTYTLSMSQNGNVAGSSYNRTGGVDASVKGRVRGSAVSLTVDYVDLLGARQREYLTGELAANARQMRLSGKGKWSAGCTQVLTKQ